MLKLGTFIYQYGLCCCIVRPSFFFDCFVNIWATCKIFLGKWFTVPHPPPPLLAENCPHAYEPKSWRCQIQQGFYPWRANTLQAYRDIPIHEFLFVSPTRRHKRLHQRRLALRLLRTNSSEITFEENMRNFSTRLKNRDYPATTVEKHLSEVIFADRKKALEQRNKNASKKILPFVTQYHPALPNLKNILMGKWHLIQNQPYLRNIFKEPPLISYRKGKSLKDTPVRAKLWRF